MEYLAVYMFYRGIHNMWFSAKNDGEAMQLAKTTVMEKCRKEMNERFLYGDKEKEIDLYEIGRVSRGQIIIFFKKR